MRRNRFAGLFLFLALASAVAYGTKPKPCFAADQAAKMLKKDICISAHVYEVVELDDGSRYLDVCSPDIPDDHCKFTIVSLREDRKTVGDLNSYRNKNVQIRGTVQAMSGRAGIFLSHARQFSGGPPKFTPNPLLARGFSAEQSRPPLTDPSLRHQAAGRAFMTSQSPVSRPR
jgi:hypothetical protein